jgi:hypothetical protein
MKSGVIGEILELLFFLAQINYNSLGYKKPTLSMK